MRKLLLVSATALLLPMAAMAQNTTAGATAASNSPGSMTPSTNAMSSSTMSNSSKVSSQDRTFVNKAAMAGMSEVQGGQLAAKMGNSQVQEVGNRMIVDHTKLNNQLKSIAQAKGIQCPTNVSSSQSAKTQKLQGMSGKQFDMAYLTYQKTAHEKAIALFQKEANDGSDQDLKTFAQNGLPVLKMHLQLIESTMKSMK